jgi:replicative DNA helicase
MTPEIILSQLIKNEEFSKVAIAHVETEYFEEDRHQVVHHLINDHIKKYNSLPGKSTLLSEIETKKLPEKLYQEAISTINQITEDNESYDYDWLINNTEEYCKQRGLDNALIEAVAKSETDDKGEIPEILKKALSITFDNHIGHDYFADAEERFEFYNQKLNKIPFDIDLLNTITNGGLPKKTLSALLAGTAVGKTMFMCHLAAAYMAMGYNVLYITLEMAEEQISKRIDANLFDLDIAKVENMEKSDFDRIVNVLSNKITGKLIVKEYPTSMANVGHIRHLLSELKLKKNFKPDVLIIDYINIMSSFRHKTNKGMYEYIKSIGEEVRGLCVENDVIGWTATQVNRDGLKSNDFDITETAESMGFVHTLDFFLGLISTEELERINLLKVKQLKNRYASKDNHSSFTVGVDRSKMKIYNCDEQSAVTPEAAETNVETVKNRFEALFEQ